MCTENRDRLRSRERERGKRGEMETLKEEKSGKQGISRLIVLSLMSASRMVPSAISRHRRIDISKENVCECVHVDVKVVCMRYG